MKSEKTIEQYLNLAKSKQEQGQLEEAIEIYHQIIQLFPNNYKSYNYLGKAVLEFGQLEKAIAIFRQGIQLQPNFSWFYDHLGQALVKKNDLPAAIVNYHQAISLEGDVHWFHLHLAQALTKQGDLPQAIVSYQRSISLNPDDPWLYFHLGKVFFEEDNLPQAIINYQQAISLQEDIPWFYLNLGHTLIQQGNLAQAIINYQQAIALKQDDPWLYYPLAQALSQQGNLQAAIDIYRRGIELNPNLSDFYENIYYLQELLDKNNTKNIFTLKNKPVKDKLVLEIESLQKQSELYLGQNKLELALKYYQKIIDLDSDYGRIYYQIGKIYQKLNQIDLAQKYYHQASIYQDLSAESKVILVCFSARHITPQCRFHFLNNCSNLSIKKLFLRDLQDAWYNKGLPGITKNVEQTATYLKTIIDQQNVNKVVFIGASSGAYAAILFGTLLVADEIHAFAAQTKIPNNSEEVQLLQDLDPTYFDLTTVYQSKESSAICHLYFDNQFPPDLEHAHRLKHLSSVKLHGYNAGFGHKIAVWLSHQQLLQPILLNAIKYQV